MVNWIQTEKLVDILLGDSTHDEMIKRSNILLKFLNDNNAIDFGILNVLWKC